MSSGHQNRGHKPRGTKARPFIRNAQGSGDHEYGLAGELHVIGEIKVKNFSNFGSNRFVELQREAIDHNCEVERFSGRGKGYTFTSCDTGPAGVRCSTLDEIDEELDNFR